MHDAPHRSKASHLAKFPDVVPDGGCQRWRYAAASPNPWAPKLVSGPHGTCKSPVGLPATLVRRSRTFLSNEGLLLKGPVSKTCAVSLCFCAQSFGSRLRDVLC
jgi:hypothetical protein